MLNLPATGKSFVSAGLSLWMHLPKHRGHWSHVVKLRSWKRPRSLQQRTGMEAGLEAGTGTRLMCSLCVPVARTPAWHPPAAALAWKPLLSSSTEGTEAVKWKGTGEQCSHLGKIHPTCSFRTKNTRLSCLKHCPVLRQPAGYRCHTTPLWRGILYVCSLPCYFWLLKQQRTNILFSSALLVQEKSASDGSAAHVPHLRPHVAPLVFGSDWWLVPRPCYQEPNGFFSMSCPLSRKFYELLG